MRTNALLAIPWDTQNVRTEVAFSVTCPQGKYNKEVMKMKREISIAEKSLLTLEEAAGYFNIGINKLRNLTNDDHCPFVIWNGSKRLIKRKLFEEYLYNSYSV